MKPFSTNWRSGELAFAANLWRFANAANASLPRATAIFVAFLVALSSFAAEELSKPLTPAQEKATFHFADERLIIELVAAEPEVVSPVAITFDADGRLYVAEM